jgi:DNA primase
MTVVEYLRLRGHKVVGRMFACPSPTHSDVHASASARGEVWYCHGCGAKGNLVGLVAQLEGCSIREAMDRLGKQPTLYVPTPPPKPVYPSKADVSKLLELAKPVDWDRTGDVPLKLAFELGPGELPAWASTWRGRVIVPLYDCLGTLRSFVARAKGPSSAKSLTPRSFGTKGLAFCTPGLHVAKGARVVIAEGEMDYLAARHLSKDVIGVRSGSWTNGWRRLVERAAATVQVCTDNDPAGHRYAREIMGVEPSPWLRRRGSSMVEWERVVFDGGDLEDQMRMRHGIP